jgi:tetratricopeptide (TPR) repeat protein
MKKTFICISLILVSIFFFSSCKKEDVGIVVNEGNIKFHHNDYQGALQNVNRGIEMYPKNFWAYHIRGNIKYALKDYSGAIQDYTKAIQLNPHSVIEYCDRGNAKKKLGDYIGAILDYTKSIEVYPYHSEAYYNRAVAKDSLKDFQSAKEDYDKYKEVLSDTRDIAAYFNMGLLHYKSKDYLASVHDFDFAIDMNPHDDSSYYYRGNSKFNLGDKSGACSDWKKAGELGITKADDLIKQYCK